MKNIFNLLFASLLIFSVSCSDSELTIDEVLDAEQGAVIRTISVDNNVVNSSDETSSWLATIEVQDGSDDNSAWSHIDAYVEMKDYTPENGDNTTDSVLLYTWTPADFENGPVGLPRADVAAPWGDIKNVLGFTGGEFSPGDLLTIKLYLNLNDGRVFGPDSAAGIITGGYFSAQFQYNALLTCSPAPGTYTIKMYDNYGDGWQTGNYALGLDIVADGVSTQVAMCSQWGTYDFECTPTTDGYFAETTYEVAPGTEVLTWTWPGDQYGEIGLIIIGPGGEIAYSSGTYLADGSGPYGDGLLADDGYGFVDVGLLPVAICAE